MLGEMEERKEEEEEESERRTLGKCGRINCFSWAA